ncbi:MAG: lipase [Cytophagaceae bacterium]|nr:lipase [Cytophagaceae bacterium]
MFIAILFTLAPLQGQTKKNEIQVTTHVYKDTLDLDFYTLKTERANKKRPLVVLLYGGGFVGGRKDGPGEVKFSQTMASFGYAAVSINYALTRKGTTSGFGCDCPTVEKMETFKHATQDVIDAVTFLKKGDFNFDPDQIILVGSSAGAEAVLNAAYQRRHPFYREIFPDDFKVAAVVGFSGAITDARYITQDDAVPGMFIHGEDDDVVPYGTEPHHFCGNETAGFFMLDGSKSIVEKLKQLKTSYKLLHAPGGKHEWSGIGFRYTDEIHDFIQTVVVEKKVIKEERLVTEND